jgi:NAD(P)-dependent dehydrogenase (short-subunit alcohol dehydrogenase family)
VSINELTGERVLVAGAETDTGRTIAVRLADAGASVAAVATTNDAETAFAVQRLSRKLGGTGQAIDATNEMAVRVMVRQVSKALGGLDAIVCTVPDAAGLITRYGGKELDRSGGKHLIYIGERPAGAAEHGPKRPLWLAVTVSAEARTPEDIAEEVVRIVSGRKLLG